jgi:hypothetical protein
MYFRHETLSAACSRRKLTRVLVGTGSTAFTRNRYTGRMRALVAAFGSISALCFAFLSSCSDDPPPAGPPVDAGPDGPPPLSEEASKFVTDFCALSQPCCGALTGAGNKCITATQAVGRGRNFDAAKAKACLDMLAEAAKSPTYCGSGPEDLVCAGVFKSATPKGPGESCTSSAECAGAGDAEGFCVGRKCQQVKRGVEGDTCVGTRHKGRTIPPDNVPDNANALCFVSDGLHCDAATAKCTKRGAPGAPCSPTDHGSECADTAWCNPATNQCAARAALGAACKDPSECAAGAYCATETSGSGVCKPAVQENGSCPRRDECDKAASLVCDPNFTRCVANTAVYEQTCSGAAALDI